MKKTKKEIKNAERRERRVSLPAPLLFRHTKREGVKREREEKRGEMTRQLDTSIKAGQRKPGLEAKSKPSTRGTRGEHESWSRNKDAV